MNNDLGPNKQRLAHIAASALACDVLVDLGVRTGVSSFTMLDATQHQRCEVIGVDPAPCPFIEPERYQYLRMDSVSAAEVIPALIYLVFFDTLHIREQVMAELFHYWPKIRVGGWAVFHDTEWPAWKHDEYLGVTWGQAIEGVRAFFGEIADTRGLIAQDKNIRFEHHSESYGMTFVQKLSDWNPTVPGMDLALSASKMLTEALCK